MSVLQKEIPQDWYATAFDGMSAEMAWTERTESEIKRALTMLRPQGGERILDLACGTGRHSLELVRHGFSVVGVEIGPELVEIARKDAAEQGLEAEFIQGDLRELEFETDEENHKTFEVISRALKPGGQNLIQVPNVLYARARLPQRSWIPSAGMVELVEHRWNKKDSYMEGAMIPLRFGEELENLDKRIEFRQRLYTVEELREIYASVGMSLERVFHGNGRPKEPTENQFEIFAAARKD
jgi:SAM-dependent methyltransferase